MISKDMILSAAEKHDCFYMYDESIILERAKALQDSFRGIDFLYSVKCNPHRDVVRTIAAKGFGSDAASAQEVLISLDAGMRKEDIYFSAPGKTETDIEATIGKCILIADSVLETERIIAIAKKRGMKACIGIRINPGFSFDDGKGRASKFGIDEPAAVQMLPKWKGEAAIRIAGIHTHIKSQELDAARLSRYHRNVLELGQRFGGMLGYALDFINMGSGLGIPCAPSDAEIDIASLGRRLHDAREKAQLKNTRLMIETGRYLVGQSGIYAMKVIDKKESYGKKYAILHSTMNGFLRPSVAQLICRYAYAAEPEGAEPIFTGRDSFSFTAYSRKSGQATEKVNLVGNLCTATDIIAEDIELPCLEPDDVVAVNNAGSYAATFSPFAFASLGRPAEIFVPKAGLPANSHPVLERPR